jgi:FtsP/CotA-like multicopper oxidase with cupredoxin domain
VLNPVDRDGMDCYRIRVCAARLPLHADLPATPLWTYEGVYPGPTIEAHRGRPVEIEWVNALGAGPHPIRTFIGYPGANETTQSHPGWDATGRWSERGPLPQWVVAHLHGAVVPAQSDGWPDNAMFPGMSVMGRYPNPQRAALLWYHDHAMSQTAQNVYAGLAGLYIVRDDEEAGLALPAGEHELPLLLQDRNLELDPEGMPTGALLYKLDQPYGEFYGPYTLVNGTIWPFAEVSPVPYRLRIINGSNARFYRLTLAQEDDRIVPPGVLTLIGNDGGLLPAPVLLGDAMLLGPGERVDVIADFGKCAKRRLVLRNDAPAPYPSGIGPTHQMVMEFRVVEGETGESALPAMLSKIEPIAIEPSAVTRVITLEEDPSVPGMMRLNGKGFHDGVDEMPRLGDTEIWEFRNPTDDSHPMHLHLVSFQLLSRAHLDPAQPSTQPLAILDTERGRKDVVCCHPGQATRIAMRFGPFTGQYMYHCHILEHEDHDMMRPYVVVPPGMSM